MNPGSLARVKKNFVRTIVWVDHISVSELGDIFGGDFVIVLGHHERTKDECHVLSRIGPGYVLVEQLDLIEGT